MKNKSIESVLHDWVHKLTFHQQALLMTGIRGADGSPKHDTAKAISRYLRGCVLKAAGNWNGTNNNNFMWGEYGLFMNYAVAFWEDHDHYPHHFIMHLLHCAEVIGYKHPDDYIRDQWNSFYVHGCYSFHMQPETEEQMDERLNDFGNEIPENEDLQLSKE